jgi:hypothetical protein
MILGIGYLFMKIIRLFVLGLRVSEIDVFRLLYLSSFWSFLALAEAFVYWKIRKRNFYGRESRTHVLLFALALLSPFIRDFLGWFYDNFGMFGVDVEVYVTVVNMGQLILFWSALGIGHVFFVRVVVKCYSKPPLVEEGDGTNILDDVEIYS